MNRDGGACSVPTTYDRILVTCSSATSRDHMPDEVRRCKRFCIWFCNMNTMFNVAGFGNNVERNVVLSTKS